MGGAARWWLHHSLESLGTSYGRQQSRPTLRKGDVVTELLGIVQETGASAVHAIRHYEPWWRQAEDELREALPHGCELCLHDGNYLMPPGAVTTGSGDPYKIYTPFMKALMQVYDHRDPLPEPALENPETWPETDELEDWNLLPTAPDWAGGLRENWEVGEAAAHERLDWWKDQVKDYEDDRNLPSIDGSSRLSPHLHHGEVSPREVWDALVRHRGAGADTFRKELIWRDYAQNVICQFPDYGRESYRDGYDASLWRNPARGHNIAGEVTAWQRGCTGYPIVDAGMRQLWTTGWMHNRVRMIAASFLAKHLLIDWRHGERWFWDTLVDADYGNNSVNWQWIAGTGVDSNMFVRIMAPLGQSEKFDAAGYIREWVPELANLADDELHDPDDANRRADYPKKLIGHKEARERALSAYHDMKH